MHPFPQDIVKIQGVKVLHENFEQEFEKLNHDKIKRVVFLIKPRLDMVERASRWKALFEATKRMLDYNFMYVPRRTCECDDWMNTMNMYVPEKTSFLAMNIIPLEDDVLSL